jgi:hypothetical protein
MVFVRAGFALALVFLAFGCSSDDGGGSGPRPTPTPIEGARAFEITDEADLLSGPLAHGRIGDYMLANSVARFVIQAPAQRDMYSVGQYGGNIIDAELVERPGTDNFLEIQPAVNVETVINAQTLEVVNDGTDGEPAVIRTCGPDDTLDFVNPSTIIEDIGGLPFPPSADDVDYDVEGCTDYILDADVPWLRVETTIFNNQSEDLPLFVGDYINAAGELGQWTSSAAAGIGELLTTDLGVMSFIGYGEATGVDYSHTTLRLPESTMSSSSFTASGVSYVMHSQSTIGAILGTPSVFVVPAQGSNSFVRYFGVGDGSGGNAIDMENAVKNLASGTIRGCVTRAGAPAAAARVAVGELDGAGAVMRLATQFVTGADGCYAGTLRPGSYGVAGAMDGTPYEGGGSTPMLHTFAIAAGEEVVRDIALPATGRLRVQVVDEEERPVPARISVVGFDPSPEPIFAGSDATGFFNDAASEPARPFGIANLAYTDSAGVVEIDIEPGEYHLYVSRGIEYSLYEAPLEIVAGETAEVDAQIARVVDTTGFVSSDFHVHGINSADSRVSHADRVRQFAGEGVDNIVMTDHHVHTDLAPKIAELGFEEFVKSTIGEEITTWDYGHFNSYPRTVDPSRPSAGSTDWGVAAPPGEDFTSRGAYCLPPDEIEALANDGPTGTADTVVQINHIDSHFDPLRIDTGQVPPSAQLSAAERIRFRLDPDGGELFHHFPALEVWNSDSRGGQAGFLGQRMGIWFNHLNQGLVTTAIADTDTHQFFNLNSAGARSWTASSTDAPADIEPGEVARSVRAGRAIGSQGPFVLTRLLANDGSGDVAELALGAPTTVASDNGSVDLEIHVQSPVWAAYDRIEIYANATTVVAASNDGVPTLYGAEPTRVLVAGEDFEVDTTTVVEEIAGAQRLESRVVERFDGLEEDTWFVVVVRGSDGVSPPLFPVMADGLARDSNTTLADLTDGNLDERGVLALAFTNALYADVDGEPGFQAPLEAE